MMNTIKYEIKFLSYWAVGSGKGGGLGADAVVLKENELPIIPGKTLKGLVREAFNELYDNDSVDLFGHHKKENDDDKTPNKKGKVHFGSARLPKELREGLMKNSNISRELYHTRTSTALEDGKQAKENSLRKMQVCIPLTLEAEIEVELDEHEKKQIKLALKGLRFIGEKRYRGLGRCIIEIINSNQS